MGRVATVTIGRCSQLLSESEHSAGLISGLNQIVDLIRQKIRSAVGGGDFLSGFRHSGATAGKKDAYDAVLHFYDGEVDVVQN